MTTTDEQLKLIQKWHWENYVHYERAFSRYLLIGGGASIGLILNFLKATPSSFQGCISFDTAVWLFTFNILIAGYCIFLNSQYSALNMNNFSHLIGYNSGPQTARRPSFDKLSDLHDKQQVRVKKYQKLIIWLQHFAAFLFAIGLLMSVYLATKIS